MSLVDQESDSQALQVRIRSQLIQHPGELLQRRHNDRLAISKEHRQMICLLRDPDDVREMRELFNVISDILIQGTTVRQNERNIDKFLIRAGLEQTVQPFGQPADGQRLTAASRMLDQILFADVSCGLIVSCDVIGQASHETALVIAGKNCKRG